MSKSNEVVTGTLDVAIAHATRLLASQPALAAEQAAEILRAVPGSIPGRLVLGQAKRRMGDAEGAIAVLSSLAAAEPRAAIVQFELAMAHSALGRPDEAIGHLQAAIRTEPRWPDAWRELADLLDATGDVAGAESARARFLTCAVNDPRLRSAAAALQANDLARAEPLLREHLRHNPTDIAALRMLSELAMRLRRYRDAASLLARCLELAPGFRPAMHQYATALFRLSQNEDALKRVEALLHDEPNHLGYLTLKAAILAHLGDTGESVALYERIVQRTPGSARMWLNLGHCLKTAGRTRDCIDAYRRAISLEPANGDAYWSLANLKTFRFSDADVEAMEQAVGGLALTQEQRLQLEFALGKACEDREQYAASFSHYFEGARIRRNDHPYRPEEATEHVQRCKAVFTPEFLRERSGRGHPAHDPIFILGLPRSGSTLIEQILASHPLVEGTMELAHIPGYVQQIADEGGGRPYVESLVDMPADRQRGFGVRFLEETRVLRKSGAPHFIDKLPNNFLHIGLIHLILPNARIIDARRHPLACCFSNFKQHFARGQNFSYSLDDLGRFYRDYVELMAHFDAVLPGTVHRVIYEQMVDDPEGETRRLLEYCGLEFDERCLRFYENDRAVRTASAEQVRQPIYRSGLDQWKHFDPWLGELRAALGDVLDGYPAVPSFGRRS